MRSMSHGASMPVILLPTLLLTLSRMQHKGEGKLSTFNTASAKRRTSSIFSAAPVMRWLISAPPLLYLILFFAIPTLIMVVAAFRFPGDYGGLAPLFDAAGKLD